MGRSVSSGGSDGGRRLLLGVGGEVLEKREGGENRAIWAKVKRGEGMEKGDTRGRLRGREGEAGE